VAPFRIGLSQESKLKAKTGRSGMGSVRVFFLAQTVQARPVRLLNRSLKEFKMSLELILIIVVVVFLLGGGGWFWQRGRG
jgi:hypothetical protein